MEKIKNTISELPSMLVKPESVSLLTYILVLYVHSLFYYLIRDFYSSMFLVFLTCLSTIIITSVIMIYSKDYLKELEKGIEKEFEIKEDMIKTPSGNNKIREVECNKLTMRIKTSTEGNFRIIARPSRQKSLEEKINRVKISKKI